MIVAVVDDARGAGIGTALIDALASRAAERFEALALNVHHRNPAARLYARTGFTIAGRGRGRFGVAMRRNLTSPPGTLNGCGDRVTANRSPPRRR